MTDTGFAALSDAGFDAGLRGDGMCSWSVEMAQLRLQAWSRIKSGTTIRLDI
jgi:hypothetical protein